MTLKINFSKIKEKILWLMTTFMYVSCYIFSTYSWGKYVLVMTALIILFFGIILNQTSLSILKINVFHIIQLLFAIFCLFSSVWSLSSATSLSRTFTMLQLLVFFSIFMIYFMKFDSIDQLLSIIMWGGYIVSIYFISKYGGLFTTLDVVINGTRFANDFANVNAIGILCAFACIIQYQKILYEKNFISSFFLLPTILVLIACQSRKSIIFLVIGIFLITLFKNINNKSMLISFFKTLIALLLVFVFLKAIFSFEIFSSFLKRFEGIIALITGEGHVDSSTEIRNLFITIGLKYFYKNPLFGYGIASSDVILFKGIYTSAYFHNNYIELLTGVGVVGFLIYYSNYIYLIYQLFKYRNYSSKNTYMCITILLLLLAMDFAMVTYYEKVQYFYFIICYIQLEISKRNWRKSYEQQNYT